MHFGLFGQSQWAAGYLRYFAPSYSPYSSIWGIMLIGSEIGCFALLGGIILAVLAFLLALGAFFVAAKMVIEFVDG